MLRYLYGLVPASATPPAEAGVHDAEVTVWDLGEGLGALASASPEVEVQPRRAHLTAHDRVLAAAMAEGPVLPLRFGIVSDVPAEAVLADLDAPAVLERMARLQGHVEVQVLWDLDEQAALERVVAVAPEVRGSDRTAVDRGRMVADVMSTLAVDDLTAVVGRLADLVAEHVPTEPRGTAGARVALLVATDHVDDLVGRVDELSTRARAMGDLRAVPGLPPYSFADLTVDLAGV